MVQYSEYFYSIIDHNPRRITLICAVWSAKSAQSEYSACNGVCIVLMHGVELISGHCGL